VSKILKSSGGIGAATLASRVLGLVRDQFFAAFMGTHGVAAAFSYAFMVPNLFRRLLGEGALTAAFIPIFKAKEKNEGETSMWQAANAVISGLLVVAPAIVLLATLLLSLLLLLGGWDADTRLMFQLMRLMFPYMILACLGAIFMGILNARGHFFIPALSPAILNVVLIASVWFVAPHCGATLETRVFALAGGVLVAGVAQALFQVPPMVGEGFRCRWVSPWRDPTTRAVVTQMIPSAIGVAAFQLNVTLVLAIAFWVSPQIVASFNYAVRLMELPQGMFGISLATYLLPTLSGLAAEKNFAEFRATLRHGVGTLIFLNLIAAILLVVLAEPIVRLLFERGAFTADSTGRAALALMCLAPGLVAFSTVNVLARAFYALGDTQTPMKISIVCLALNFILAAMLVVPLRQGGLGLANTATSIVNVGLLFYALRRKLGKLEMETLRAAFLPLTLAGVLAGASAWFGWQFWEKAIGHETLALKIGAVFVPAGIAGLLYGLVALAFKVPAAREMVEFALARFKKSR